jgi:hypothetical protein
MEFKFRSEQNFGGKTTSTIFWEDGTHTAKRDTNVEEFTQKTKLKKKTS